MATDHGEHNAAPHGPINHETTDIDLEGVGKITLGFALFMALVVAAMYGSFLLYASREAAGQRVVGPMVEQAPPARPAARNEPNRLEGGRTPAGPRLLTNEPLNLREHRTEQTARLHSYGWVNREGGVVHVPIERAIELVAERGLPVSPAAVAAPETAAEPAAPDAAEPAAPDVPDVPGTP